MSTITRIYVVTAYRWGQRNAHSYVVGAFDNLESAKAVAQNHMEYRGGKYACEVTDASQFTEDQHAPQVFYVESPYFGMAGDAGHFHAADISKPCRPARAPFTVRELQNRVGDLERELAEVRKREVKLEELLTCARCIAERRGVRTAWSRFANSIKAVGIGSVTARTYHVLPEEDEDTV